MSFLASILLIVYAISVGSLAVHIRRTAALTKQGSDGFPDDAPTLDRLPAIDVVVPVKDEENNIGRCLRAIIAERYPNARIFVVNDRSTDGTANVVRAIQEEHPEIERIDITHLQEGYYGKPSALEKIASRLTGDILFFIDSDMFVKPGCFKTVVRRMESERLDWLAAHGEMELDHFWEKVLAPVFGAMAYSWYDPRKVSDPNWPDAMGSGFMVVRRESYMALGGHGAVKNCYDEDSVLLRRAKAAGQRVVFTASARLFNVRMYGSLDRTIRGFHRTLIGGLKTTFRFLITINALQFVSLMPFGLIILIPLLGGFGYSVPFAKYWLGFALLHILLATWLAALVYRAAKVPLKYALLHPLGSAVAIWVCCRAAADLRRRAPITWRGTSYASAEHAVAKPGQ
ncbi:MAG: glycosyltransferase [Phycisphaerae bacterium]|nr:glycosyltransferase [Phycisphaerae bacterium]